MPRRSKKARPGLVGGKLLLACWGFGMGRARLATWRTGRPILIKAYFGRSGNRD
jgi:hypothetical protein